MGLSAAVRNSSADWFHVRSAPPAPRKQEHRMRTGTPRSRFTRTRARPSAAGPKASTPDGRIEPLERRVLLATFVVSTADESGPGSIREALAMAEANSGPDTIAFDESLAAPGTKITVSSPLVLNGPVTVLGPERAKLTLEGNNATRVLDVASDAVVALSGLRISGGSADGGGGIRNQGTLTLDHVLVSGNSATGFGGGISNLFGTLTLHNSSVSRNSAQYGAGLSNDFGDVTLLDSDISNNTASNGGGGVINQATLTLTRSTVSGNAALNGIGGGTNNGGTLNINHATTVNTSASFSGGVDYSFSGTATIVYGNVSGNSARTGGGIGNSGKLTLANSSVSGNTAVSRGGGISQSGGTATLINVTVSGNSVTASSGSGGGIDSTAALEIYSTTVADNRAARGGGIRVIGDTKLYNSLIAN